MKINADKKHFGTIGERVDIAINDVECITSFETEYGTMRIYRFETISGEVLIWKTSNFIDDIDKVAKIKATIKNHGEYNGEKQTEINRVKVVG